ncbi:hypothetical protein XA68_14058 [Ophiocordyceps unilateralis]|uniref:Uncharacterized protein n=1 Tax=Ophiocordyceps unilateralis TaxID=268505 RepID=A0A2A9PMP4_OPHUN|nr:hypothetical protein XA68_14058 [Ophiocordyceps unilateralis]
MMPSDSSSKQTWTQRRWAIPPPRETQNRRLYVASLLPPDIVGQRGIPSRTPDYFSCIFGSSVPPPEIHQRSIAAYREAKLAVKRFKAVSSRCRLSGQPYIYEVPRGNRTYDWDWENVYTLEPAWINPYETQTVRYARAGGPLEWKQVEKQEAADDEPVFIVSMATPEFSMEAGIPPIEENHGGCTTEFRLPVPGTTRSWIVGFRDEKRAVDAFLKLRKSECPYTYFYIYSVRSGPHVFPVSDRQGLPKGSDAVVTNATNWLGTSNSGLLRYARLPLNGMTSALSIKEIGELIREATWVRQNATDQDLEEALGPRQDCSAAEADQLVAKRLNKFFKMMEHQDYSSMAGPQEVARRLQLPVSELTDSERLDNTACAISLRERPIDFNIAPGARGVVVKGDCCRLRDKLQEILQQHRTVTRPSRSASLPIESSAVNTRTCTHFSQLSLGFQLHNDSKNDGTRDTVQVSIGNADSERIVGIARHPQPGFHAWTKLNLETMFDESVVAKSEMTHIGIGSMLPRDFTRDDLQDGWYFQGLKLRGHCAGSSLVLEVDKFASVNKWLERPAKSSAAFVWGGSIKEDDWHVTGCSRFNSLHVHLVISSLPGSDTGDDILIHFNNGSRATDTLLMRSPRLGAQTDKQIDLATTFGSHTVSVEDVQSFEIYSKAPVANYNHGTTAGGGWRSGGRGWRSGGVSLRGQCASSRSWVAFWGSKETHYRDRIDGHDTSLVLRHKVSAEDWEWSRWGQSTQQGMTIPV